MTKRHPYEGLRQVAIIACGIVLEHSHKQTKWSKAARVPYETLRRLERALDAAGFGMVAIHKRYQQNSQPVEEIIAAAKVAGIGEDK